MVNRNKLISELYDYQEDFYAQLLEMNRQQLWNMSDAELLAAHKNKFEDYYEQN